MLQGREILAKDNLLDENASEETETVEERCTRLEMTLDQVSIERCCFHSCIPLNIA